MFWFDKKDETALDTVVRAAGKPATSLIIEKVVTEGHLFPAISTHFGGNPYFEMGETWPTLGDDERPYDFVCQVYLRDCPERPDVPFDLFTVFLCWSTDDIDRVCLVRTYRHASAAKAISIPRPAPHKAEDYRVRPCALRMESFMTYPWSMKRFPAILAAASRFRNPEGAYVASLKRLRSWGDFRSRVGGYPTWVHDNTLEGDKMVFLAQIGYEPQANNCIGDAAPIYIAVSTTDPPRIEIDASQTF
jgi:hypothetical protein